MPLAETVLGAVAGSVYVTHSAAKTYTSFAGLDREEARRELTAYLCEARQTHAAVDGAPELWRYRSRSTGLDISARVVWEEPLAVVVSVQCRGVRRESSQERAERRRRGA